MRTVVAVATAGLAMFLAVVVPAASSHPAPVNRASAPPAMQPRANPLASATAGESVRAAGSTIRCTLKVNYPHHSTHNPLVINVVATWKCTSRVYQLTMTVKLFTGGIIHLEIAKGGPFRNNGKAKLSGNASFPCITSGFYFGKASGTVIFPRGYTPHKVNLNVQSGNNFILCP